jgi:hypothetical protein
LSNVYKRSFVEFHFKLCDLIHNDLFLGAAMKQGKLAQPCPYKAVNIFHCYLIKQHRHNQHFLIPINGVGACFLLPFSNITCHLHAYFFYPHAIFQTAHRSFLKSNSTTLIYIHTQHSFCYVLSFLCITCPYEGSLFLLIFSVSTLKFN